MIDALLHAVRQTIIDAQMGYDYTSCDIMPDEKPPVQAGDLFVAVHQGKSSSDMMNALDEYFDFILTLTMRLRGIPLSRVGDQLMAKKTAEKTGFNRRANALVTLLHMDWQTLGLANNNLLDMLPDAEVIYGFSEPAQFAGMEKPQIVGSEHFGAEPDDPQVGLKADIFFTRCRRGPQAIEAFS